MQGHLVAFACSGNPETIGVWHLNQVNESEHKEDYLILWWAKLFFVLFLMVSVGERSEEDKYFTANLCAGKQI